MFIISGFAFDECTIRSAMYSMTLLTALGFWNGILLQIFRPWRDSQQLDAEMQLLKISIVAGDLP